MALPTHGRVILNTTAGEIDIELWSKVRTKNSTRRLGYSNGGGFQGNTESMPEFHSARTRGCVQQRTGPRPAADLAFTGRIL
jgi:hypothetical protein